MDLNIAKKEFTNYIKNYDNTIFHIKRKISHSFRVMQLSTQIASSLNLTQEEIDIATLIGLLHDIARFEQYTQYHTFNDGQSFDHGEYGVKILQNNNYIRKYIEENTYDNTIYTAINNHNKFQIASDISNKDLIFCKIIRDADKLDILYQDISIYWSNATEEIEKMENIKIREKHMQPFMEKRLINRVKDLPLEERPLVHLLIHLGFIFDINCKETYRILKEKDYINTIINRFDFKDEQTKNNIEIIRKIINETLNSKMQL